MDKLINHTFFVCDYIDFCEKCFDDYTINRFVRGYLPTVIGFLISRDCPPVSLPTETLDLLDLVVYLERVDKSFGFEFRQILLYYEMLPDTIDECLHL